ncbi:hypothetical protein [Cytobacillus praedii]|uniref:hypothetical protein n=1 Tax=Cytobacillus praedii TaxID=1742358 RepID=UPI002E248A35|nr:hypothetical protein [Cytobacillus praedii]
MHSIGKTLAVVLHAPQPMSYFRRSGMDGFAVVSVALMNEQKGVAAMSQDRYSRQQNFRPNGAAGQQALGGCACVDRRCGRARLRKKIIGGIVCL